MFVTLGTSATRRLGEFSVQGLARKMKYLELILKLGLLRVKSWKVSVLRVNFGSELAFSGFFLG